MSQPDEFLDRQPSEPTDAPRVETCPDCHGALVWDDGLPCETCGGTGRWEYRPAPLDREGLRRLEAALVGIWGRS